MLRLNPESSAMTGRGATLPGRIGRLTGNGANARDLLYGGGGGGQETPGGGSDEENNGPPPAKRLPVPTKEMADNFLLAGARHGPSDSLEAWMHLRPLEEGEEEVYLDPYTLRLAGPRRLAW